MMKHDLIVEKLESRLRDSYLYDSVETKLEYKTHGKEGECDILAVRLGRACLYVLAFEAKTTNSKKSQKRAYDQILRDLEFSHDRFNGPIRYWGFCAHSRGEGFEFHKVYKAFTP